jgi:hypothetical protein
VVPCYRCHTRQADPARGASPWRRGVRAGVQVLVCPACQRSADWQADLDRCPDCDSTRLIRRLGETVCRSCDGRAARESPEASGPPPVPGLADDVEAALRRMFGS